MTWNSCSLYATCAWSVLARCYRVRITLADLRAPVLVRSGSQPCAFAARSYVSRSRLLAETRLQRPQRGKSNAAQSVARCMDLKTFEACAGRLVDDRRIGNVVWRASVVTLAGATRANMSDTIDCKQLHTTALC
jgi:hypothetical protein